MTFKIIQRLEMVPNYIIEVVWYGEWGRLFGVDTILLWCYFFTNDFELMY